MKTYTKPSMMVLSISANDPLCTDCLIKTRFEPAISTDLETDYGNADGVSGFFSRVDADAASAAYGTFGDGEGCDPALISIYCKFTSANTLFTS